MSETQPVLVIGGTRGTGLLIVGLLQKGRVPVRVLARDPAAAAARLGPEVEVVAGDLTGPATLPSAVRGTRHIIFTAGVRSMHPASESLIKATEYDGTLNTLTAARDAGFNGRLLYMTSIGTAASSLSARFLDLFKGNTLVWRRRAEDGIRASGIDYTIIRVGLLLNGPAGQRAVEVSQGALPLTPFHRIARADVAEAFVAAMQHPHASRTTFEVVWGRGRRTGDWTTLLDDLRPDS